MGLGVIPEVKSYTVSDGYYRILENEDFEKTVKTVIDPDIEGDETYILKITPTGVTLASPTQEGLFRGRQTLGQLAFLSADGKLACCRIEDSPRYRYRSFMLDSARHMPSVRQIKKMIDAAALFKFNVFHWHISDDQGFRFESKKYPLLNEIGSYRKSSDFGKKHVSGRYGGFYTREEMADVIKYCRDRFITVIPEIDMPGHVSSLIASYPYLSCEEKPIDVVTKQGIFPDILCAGKVTTYSFVKDLLDEVCEVFDGEYIHIGGDEAPKTKWRRCPYCRAKIAKEGLKNEEELQGFFVNEIAEYLKSKGKKVICWNESLKSGLVGGITAQMWMDRDDLCVKYANAGGDVIISDFYHYYLDYPYGMTPLDKVYNYKPESNKLNAVGRQRIIGVETPLWSEFIDNDRQMEFMFFPRMTAVAEAGWTDEANKNCADYKLRLSKIIPMLQKMGIEPADESLWNVPFYKRIHDIGKHFGILP